MARIISFLRPTVAKFLYAVVVLCLVPPPSLMGQEFHTRHYRVDDGLPHSQVRDLLQDASGTMWFATRSGIASYDGREWRTFNVAHGLSWADQAGLSLGPAGRLWSVSTQTPLKIFVLEDDRWREEPGPTTPPGCRVTAFEVFGNPTRPTLAIGTDHCGLLLGQIPRWRRITQKQGLPGDGVVGLAASAAATEASDRRRSRLLIGTTGGAVELLGSDVQGRLAAVAGAPPQRSLRGLVREAPARASGTGTVWLVGDDWIGRIEKRRFELLADGLTLFESGTQARPVAARPVAARPVAARPVAARPVAARPDQEGGLYLADPTRVAYFHPDHGVHVLGRRNGLLADGATSLEIDHEGNVWLGSDRGVTKVISWRFAKYTRRQGLFNDEVTATAERSNGEIVLGHPGGITRMGTDGSTITRELKPRPDAGPGSPEPERVRDMAEDALGNLWVAVDSYGLARLEPAGGLTWFGAREGLHGAVTSVLAEHRDGCLWAATDQGLFERCAGNFEAVGAPGSSTGSSRLHVRRIFPDPGTGAVLLATASGLYRFDGTEFQTWSCEDPGCGSVFSALPGGDGVVWAGTAAGLYTTRGEALVEVVEPRIDEPVFFMVRDTQQRVWFGTDNGVLRWDGENLRHLTIRDGLAGRETHRAAGLVDSRGDIWIGSARGATLYSERLPSPQRHPPIVEILGIDAKDGLVPLDQPLELDYRNNDLTFYFRAASLVDEDRLHVQVLLEGADDDWRPLAHPTDRSVRYSNLSPGTYNFSLEAANADEYWSGIVRSPDITIAAPYWRQSWFFVLCLVSTAGTFYFARRVIAQRRYSRKLEAEVARRVEELRASEERYRHTFERSQAVMLLIDADTLEILDANRVACRFYGYDLERLQGRSLDDLRVRRDPDSKSLDLTTKTGTHLLAEQHRLANGKVRDVELYSSATEFRGRDVFNIIVQDITELRLAEESTTAERARLSVTLQHIDDGVITTGADGRILLLNRKAEEITGWTRFQAVGRQFREILKLHQEGDGVTLGAPIELAVGDDALPPIHGAILETRDGQRKVVELSGSPIRKAAQTSGLVLAFRDISERRRLEGELAKSQRLEALGLLAGGIAHDFNNLLTVLLGNLSLIGRALHEDPERQKHLADAETAVMRARDLTQQLLTFSRGGAPIREAAAIDEVITDSASFVLAGSKVRCEIDLPDDLRIVEIDAGQISQVINNLLINAMQAMPEGGVVKIRGENLDDPPSPLPGGSYLAIHVSDRGVGIPQEYLTRIFDPYFSTKEQGRGLGLASAYSIAKQHDGLLTVESRVGRGTTFTLYLPASRLDAAPVATITEELPAGHGRILVMDDEAEVRQVTRTMAEQLGYRVDSVADGEEALRLYRQAREHDQPYDIVIMDLTIPGGMGGQETIRELLALDPGARAIVSSGYSNDPVLANYREQGFLGRIAKPFRIEDLDRALREVFALSSPKTMSSSAS